jgi:hypothetical protein
MLSGSQGRPFAPGGVVALLRGETQESVDDLLVETTESRYAFIQAKRSIDFSEKIDSDSGSVIDQVVRQIVEKPADGVHRPWTRELTAANDRLLLVTTSRSSEKIKVQLKEGNESSEVACQRSTTKRCRRQRGGTHCTCGGDCNCTTGTLLPATTQRSRISTNFFP